MNDSPSNDDHDELAQSDSRLKSFLRQSAGIIAGEKGMTAACQVKLQALAEQIKLPPATFEMAMAQLRGSQLDVEQLTRYEAAFLSFLKSEIQKLGGDVMSPRMEKAAIEIARDKYQIESSIAQRLIEEQCDSMGVSRVSHDEAQTFARQAIVKQLADHVYIGSELQDQLYRIGKSWGLDQLAVDQITIPIIAENRNRKVGSNSKVTPLTIVLLGLLGIALVGYWTWPEPIEQVGRVDDSTSSTLAPATNSGTSKPKDLELSFVDQRLAELSDLQPSVRETLERFLRTTHSDQFLEPIVEEDDPSSSVDGKSPKLPLEPFPTLDAAAQALSDMLADGQWCKRPSDQATTLRWLTEVLSGLPLNRQRVINAELGRTLDDLDVSSDRALPVERVLRVNQVIVTIMGASLSRGNTREAVNPPITLPGWYRDALRYDSSDPTSDTGLNSDSETIDQLLAKTESTIVNEQWDRFTAFAFAKPEHASTLLPELIRASDSRLDKERLDRWKRDSILSLAKEIATWSPRFVELCRSQIESLTPADNEPTQRWASVLLKQNAESYFEPLAQALIKATEIQTSIDHRSAKATLEKYVAVNRYGKFRPLLDRVDQVVVNTNNRLNAVKLDGRQLPQQIANVAIAVNLELALIRVLDSGAVGTTADDGAGPFQAFDQQIENATPLLREQVSLQYAQARHPSSSSNVSLQATASDIRHKENALAKITEKETSVEFQLLALRQLSRSALRFPDLNYAECRTLVDFFLSNLPGKQQLELQQLLSSYSHWPTISLALADSLEVTDAKMDLVLTTARLLVRHDFEIEDAGNWQQELRLKILTLANDDLAVRIANDPAGESADWTRLKIFLTGVMQQRRRLISNGQKQESASKASSSSLFDLAVEVAETETGRKNFAPLVRLLSRNELDQLAVLNQLICSERKAENLTSLAPMQSADNFGERLWESERLLLRTYQQQREKAVETFLQSRVAE